MAALINLKSFVISVSLVAGFSAAVQAAPQKSREEWKTEYVRPTEIPFPEENPYSAGKADLGKKLFFDPRLSGANYISCATCHNPSFAWGDGLPKGIGHGMARLGRRTPTILNLAWGELLMWDGRFESLEEQALGPMSAPVEMNQEMDAIVQELAQIPGYRNLFNVVFPGEGLSVPNIAKAIATFERTIVSGVAPFDHWIAGDEAAISEPAKRGFDLFNGKANCVACHSGWNFTDDSFHDIGLPDKDIGRGNEVPGVKTMQHAFKVPTLRNSVERAPYMHDGSQKNLFSVVRHYNDGFVQRDSLSDQVYQLKLSATEQADVVAFLQTLSSVDAPMAMPVLPPYDQTLAGSLSGLTPAAGPQGNDAKATAPSCGGLMHHWQSC